MCKYISVLSFSVNSITNISSFPSAIFSFINIFAFSRHSITPFMTLLLTANMAVYVN